MITWTKYIRKELRGEYEKLGWVVEDKLRNTPHGEWSFLGKWAGDGDPKLPEMEAIQKD